MKLKGLIFVMLFSLGARAQVDSNWLNLLKHVRHKGTYYQDFGYYGLTVKTPQNSNDHIANSLAASIEEDEENVMIGTILCTWIEWKVNAEGNLVGDKWMFEIDPMGGYQDSRHHKTVHTADGITQLSDEFIPTELGDSIQKWQEIKEAWIKSIR